MTSADTKPRKTILRALIQDLCAWRALGARDIEQVFEELLKLSNCLDDEQERHVREQLTEEELVVFEAGAIRREVLGCLRPCVRELPGA